MEKDHSGWSRNYLSLHPFLVMYVSKLANDMHAYSPVCYAISGDSRLYLCLRLLRKIVAPPQIIINTRNCPVQPVTLLSLPRLSQSATVTVTTGSTD